MTSREEFMRSLGISDSDMTKPPPEDPTKARRKPPMSEREPDSPVRSAAPSAMPERASYKSSASASYSAAPAAAPSATPSAGGANSAARADFLRSLGIDNADDKFAAQVPAAKASSPAASSPPRNATGSQELPRSYGASSSSSPSSLPPRASHPARRNYTEEDVEQPVQTTPQKMPSDWTLGPKAATHRAPATPTLDAELKGMKDSAGAEEVKSMGNKFFQAGDYRKAVRLYTRAIELDSTNAALYSNRSAAYLLGGKQMGIDTRSMALRDAEKTVKLKPTWFKGFSRRGDALFKLERYVEAAEAYESALELDPGNSAIVNSLNEVRPFVAKAKGRDASGSWSAPGAGILNASVTSLTGKKTTEKSAFELMDELERTRERTTPHLTRGSDYKSKQLDEYRQRRTVDSAHSTDETPSYQPPQSQQFATTESASSAPRERPQVTPEFSSDAAREYQEQLLAQYRKKKQQQQQRY